MGGESVQLCVRLVFDWTGMMKIKVKIFAIRMSENNSVGNSESGKSINSDDFEGLLDEIPSSKDETAHLELTPRQQQESTLQDAHEEEETNEDDCEHPGYFAGMCVRCGKSKSKESSSDSLVPLRYVHKSLELSGREALRLSEVHSTEAESQGKLHLVLDLDHTLLNSAPLSFALATPGLEEWMEAEIEAEKQTGIRRSLYAMPTFSGMTKLRPGVFNFLTTLSELYDMHIYTMGEEQYAEAMAEILDPTGELFHGKVISRHHSSTPMLKSLDIVISSDRSTVIVDDTWQVWQQHTANLIRISKYLFFPPNPNEGLPVEQKCWLELKADECPLTGDLRRVQELLENLHTEYFHSPVEERDVRTILESLQRKKRRRA